MIATMIKFTATLRSPTQRKLRNFGKNEDKLFLRKAGLIQTFDTFIFERVTLINKEIIFASNFF